MIRKSLTSVECVGLNCKLTSRKSGDCELVRLWARRPDGLRFVDCGGIIASSADMVCARNCERVTTLMVDWGRRADRGLMSELLLERFFHNFRKRCSSSLGGRASLSGEERLSGFIFASMVAKEILAKDEGRWCGEVLPSRIYRL